MAALPELEVPSALALLCEGTPVELSIREPRQDATPEHLELPPEFIGFVFAWLVEAFWVHQRDAVARPIDKHARERLAAGGA